MAFEEQFCDGCAKAVAGVEKGSAAEIVVVVAPRSGSYADVDMLWGIMSSLVTLALILHGPWVFHPDLVLFNVVLVGLLFWWTSRRSDVMRRLLSCSRRRLAQVQGAARDAFQERSVSATRDRTGVLFYLSRLERLTQVLPDYGIDGRVPRAVWNEIRHKLDQAHSQDEMAEALLECLKELEEKLPAHLPAREDDEDELPDRPVILA